MKYSCEVTIDRPRDVVVKLFDNPDNMPKWMDDLEKFEHMEGTPGQPGAKSRLTFKSGRRTFDLIETVTSNNLPDEMTGTYESKVAFNKMRVRENLGAGDGARNMAQLTLSLLDQ